MEKFDRKYSALVNEVVGVRGYCGGAPQGRVRQASHLASIFITGRWSGTPVSNRYAAEELRAVAAELIEEAERVESYNSAKAA